MYLWKYSKVNISSILASFKSKAPSHAYACQYTGCIIDSDNAVSTVRAQAVSLTNGDLLSIKPFGTNIL